MSEQQHIAAYELQERLWSALDALSTGTWTPEDLFTIRYCTGITYTPPKKESDHANVVNDVALEVPEAV